MKFGIVLLFAAFGLTLAGSIPEEFKWENVPTSGNFSQCIYKEDVKIFSCRGVQGIVECPVVYDVTGLGAASKKMDVFGLGFNTLDTIKPEFTKFWMYPRSMDNTTYENHTVMGTDKQIDLVLYYAEKFIDYGFRVTDLKCYTSLVSMFRFSNDTHMVPVESDLLVRPMIPLFSEVMIIDKEMHKRFIGGRGFGGGFGRGFGGFGRFGFGGFGLGFGGFGLGGFGWPFWGLPFRGPFLGGFGGFGGPFIG